MTAEKILVVEDDYVLAASLDADLKAMGYRVVGLAPSGRQALAAAAQDPPDLAVMDIRLKGEMDGTEAALRLRREHGIPAVFLTAYSDQSFLDRAKRSEPLSYLLKPYSKEELRATLEVCLYRARIDKRLRESQAELQLFKALAEASQEAIAIGRPDGRLIYVNPAHERLFGRSLEEARASRWRDHYAPESIEIHDHKVAPLLARGGSWEGELEGIGAGGRRLTLWERADTIRSDDGRMAYAFSLMHDISEKKRAEERRLELERRHHQARKLETIGVLAAGIAHSFNNLLGVVAGGLDLSLMQMPDAEPLRRPLEQALQASVRARDLTCSLLSYAGKGLYAPKTFDLNELLRAKAFHFRSAISRSAELSLKPGPGPLLIHADPAGVEQIALNLILNASEAYGPQPGAITLSTGSQGCEQGCLAGSRTEEKPSPGNYACLEVVDEGCGMNAETSERLFDPFFSTKFMGRGLGMAAVKGIVQSHGGAIFVETAPGRGTTVRVLLPSQPLG